MATILLFTICDNSFAQLCFSPVSNYQMSSSYNVTSVASADFNGDGKQDLTVANANTGWMIVRPGTGVGTFGPTIYSTPPIASGYTHVISSDFNVDGKMDVADLLMLMRFVEGLAVPSAKDLVLGDMNGDTVLDIRDLLLLLKAVR